jgi:hypothetical protein
MDQDYARDVGGLPADALKNFETQDNQFSIFFADEDLISPERIAIAIAAKRDILDIVEFAVFEDQLLEEVGVEIEWNDGETADLQVNRKHADVVKSSAERVCLFAREVQRCGTLTRLTKSVVKQLLIQAVETGSIERDALNPNLSARLFF